MSIFRENRRLIALLLFAVLCLLLTYTVAAPTTQSLSDDSSPSSSSPSTSSPDVRLERKQKKLSLSDKRDMRLSEKRNRLTADSQSTYPRLKQLRLDREKKQRREAEHIKRRQEEEIKRKQEHEDPVLREAAAQKIRDLIALAAKSSTHVIMLDDAQYKQYVLDGNRPYYVFITYTAISPGATCPMCHEFQRVLTPVATQYYEDFIKTGKILQDLDSLTPSPSTPIFFINIDIVKNRDIFDQMKLSSGPVPMILLPRHTHKALKLSTVLTTTPNAQKFQLQARQHPHELVQFIHKFHPHLNIQINYNAINGEEIVIAILAVIIVGVCIYYYYEKILALRYYSHIRLLLCVGGWLVYGWCTSGGMYNIIKGNQFSHQPDKDKPIEYISGDARDQWGAEGLILGFLNLAAALSLVLCNERSGVSGSSSSTTTSTSAPLFHPKSFLGILWSNVNPILRPELCLALMAFFWFYIVSIYSWKNRGYRNGFVWY